MSLSAEINQTNEMNKSENSKMSCFDRMSLWFIDYQSSKEARVRLGKKVNYIKQFKQYFKVKQL